MKAFWLFAANGGAGTDESPNAPALPDVPGRYTCPGDIIRLTGPAGAPHRHLLVGGIGLADDNLDGEVGEGHRHYVVKVGETWQQVTVGAAAHTHTLNESAAGGLNPDYFLLFWAGSDVAAATIAADPDCWPIVEAAIGAGGTIGALDDTAWSAEERATWEARCLNVLGVELPAEVDRGKRLVLLFLGALLSRQSASELGYRFVS